MIAANMRSAGLWPLLTACHAKFPGVFRDVLVDRLACASRGSGRVSIAVRPQARRRREAWKSSWNLFCGRPVGLPNRRFACLDQRSAFPTRLPFPATVRSLCEGVRSLAAVRLASMPADQQPIAAASTVVRTPSDSHSTHSLTIRYSIECQMSSVFVRGG